MFDSDFDRLVYSAVRQIPQGCAASYGQIAALIGYPGHARQVGRALRLAPAEQALPCHRVVNHEGRPAPGWTEQRRLLEKEGVPFRESGCVDLKKCRWHL